MAISVEMAVLMEELSGCLAKEGCAQALYLSMYWCTNWVGIHSKDKEWWVHFCYVFSTKGICVILV